MNLPMALLSLLIAHHTRVIHSWTTRFLVPRFGTQCTRPAHCRRELLPHPLRANASPRRANSRWMTTSASDTAENAPISSNTTRTWNVGGLKKEVGRLILRCHKKVGKTNQRLQRLLDGGADSEIAECEQDLKSLQDRLGGLNELESLLVPLGNKKKVTLPEDIALLAAKLEVNDKPPPRPARGPGKAKGPRRMESVRKPYRRYYSSPDKIEIRVGKQAEDNDLLTMSPEHRDGSNWWMHASGCPGSHVVIRYSQENVPSEVVQDAAALAARQSKCNGSVVKVSMTRCRDIKKPFGAKAGLVQLTGNVKTISVNMKEAKKRLERLETTVLVN